MGGNDTTERFSRRSHRRDGRVQRVVDAEQKGTHDWGGGGFLAVFQPVRVECRRVDGAGEDGRSIEVQRRHRWRPVRMLRLRKKIQVARQSEKAQKGRLRDHGEKILLPFVRQKV